MEVGGNSRSVMPLDVLGRSRATMMYPIGLPNEISRRKAKSLHRDWDRSLEFLIFNGECLVSMSYHLMLNTSLPFVHTARRYYRSSGQVNLLDSIVLLLTGI